MHVAPTMRLASDLRRPWNCIPDLPSEPGRQARGDPPRACATVPPAMRYLYRIMGSFSMWSGTSSARGNFARVCPPVHAGHDAPLQERDAGGAVGHVVVVGAGGG